MLKSSIKESPSEINDIKNPEYQQHKRNNSKLDTLASQFREIVRQRSPFNPRRVEEDIQKKNIVLERKIDLVAQVQEKDKVSESGPSATITGNTSASLIKEH